MSIHSLQQDQQLKHAESAMICHTWALADSSCTFHSCLMVRVLSVCLLLPPCRQSDRGWRKVYQTRNVCLEATQAVAA